MSLPNSLTVARIILTPVFLAMLFSESSFWKQISLVVFIVAALTDYYDGYVARKYGYITRWGKFLDPLADKILSSAALFSFVALNLVDGWMVWIIVVRDFLITGLRSYAEYKDQPIVTSRPAQAKTLGEFVVLYYILILYIASNVPMIKYEYGTLLESLMDSRVLFGMMLLVTLSSVGTAAMYLFEYRKFIQEIYLATIGSRETK
ncbi:MAG: CDP-diacylglycerol--glycerol-3-phosphate 3-phosphatidyltransferase [Bacteroidetes bacterium]|nr:MAG: CDP-diacylglycerol--glycerol-3-phosphate 3-phosphatidyltransferase [Bacteroidota bacterium]